MSLLLIGKDGALESSEERQAKQIAQVAMIAGRIEHRNCQTIRKVGNQYITALIEAMSCNSPRGQIRKISCDCKAVNAIWDGKEWALSAGEFVGDSRAKWVDAKKEYYEERNVVDRIEKGKATDKDIDIAMKNGGDLKKALLKKEAEGHKRVKRTNMKTKYGNAFDGIDKDGNYFKDLVAPDDMLDKSQAKEANKMSDADYLKQLDKLKDL